MFLYPRDFLRLCAYLFILQAIVTIYCLKIGISSLWVYPLEIPCALVSIILIPHLKLSLIEKNYIFYLLFTIFSWFIGAFWTRQIDILAAVHILKYSTPILLIPIAKYLKRFFSASTIKTILYAQFMFVLINVGYLVFNYFTQPISITSMIWDYSPKYRFVGFTGYSLTSSGIQLIGTTSVQMGVYVAFLFLIFLSLFLYERKWIYLVILLIIFTGEIFCYSRSGFLVMIIGTLYLFKANFLERRTFRLIMAFIIIISLLLIFTNFANFITSFGIFAKLSRMLSIEGLDSSAGHRIDLWRKAFYFIYKHPFVLLFGSGYGKMYNTLILGVPHFESFFITTLIRSGIAALTFLFLFYFYIWKYCSKYVKNCNIRNYYQAIMRGYAIFIPGIFVACLVGGNSLQTDFIVPIFYLILGICLSFYGEKHDVSFVAKNL